MTQFLLIFMQNIEKLNYG